MGFKLLLKSALCSSVVWILVLIVAEIVFERESATIGIIATPFVAAYAFAVSFIAAKLLERRNIENRLLIILAPTLLALILLPLNWL